MDILLMHPVLYLSIYLSHIAHVHLHKIEAYGSRLQYSRAA